ncbi:hypothetical protein [Streptomyces sp. NPDC047869]|uniref:hypothetical protein n=1 Tax=Streptomyces sp. NPDC047869 TaxID=3154709 RepID=UPI003455F3E1
MPPHHLGRSRRPAWNCRTTNCSLTAWPLIESVGEDFAVDLTGHAPCQDHREREALEDLHDRY